MKRLLLLAGLLFILSACIYYEVFAHCDTLEGPVIQDARAALMWPRMLIMCIMLKECTRPLQPGIATIIKRDEMIKIKRIYEAPSKDDGFKDC